MDAPVMFNRRLREEEIEDWIDFVGRNTIHGVFDRNLAASYLQHPDTLAFISTIDNEIIGGSAIHRDRTRLGMVLSSVSIRDEYKEKSAFQVIKTSLPFMKTVAIRDVDAIVSNSPNETGIGFPASLELDAWTLAILERIGFQKIGEIRSYSTGTIDVLISEEKKKLWDNEPNIEGARQILWSQSKELGLTSSIIWSAFDHSCYRGSLRTYSFNGSTKIAISHEKINNILLVGFIVVSSDFSQDEAIDRIATGLSQEHGEKIHFPLIGAGQEELIERLKEQLGTPMRGRSLELLRKFL